jgi:hypothetical protein
MLGILYVGAPWRGYEERAHSRSRPAWCIYIEMGCCELVEVS